MGKIISLFLTLAMLVPFQTIASAAESLKDTVMVKGYIQIDGVQSDSNGNVAGRPIKYYTGIVAEGALAENHPSSFNVAIGGDVTESDVLSYLSSITDDTSVLENVSTVYRSKGYIKSSSGKIIPWDKMTTESYTVEWYVLKYEQNDDFWHLDGRIIEIETGDSIQVIMPEIPPHNKPYELENDYAYIFGRTDTLMEPDDSMKRGEAAAVIYRLLKQNEMLSGFSYDISKAPVYSDTDGRWDRSALEYMNYIGVYPDGGTISPCDNIKRGEAFKLMAVALGFTNDTSLTDEQYALILHDNNYVVGDESGNFQLDSVITRAEFCKIYNMIIGRDSKLLVTADGTEVTPKTYGFTDISESEW